MRKLIALLLLAIPCAASGPKYIGSQTDAQVYQEFGNVYHDLANPSVNVGTASTMTITNLTITHISSGPFTNWVAYTPTFSAGFGTTSNVGCFWRRLGDSAEVQCYAQCGTVGASVASISLPSSLSIDTTKVASTASATPLGTWWSDLGSFGTSNLFGVVFSDLSATNTLFLSSTGNGTTAFTKINVSGNVCGSSGGFSFRATVPISGWSF